MKKEMLWLTCRYHILEIMPEAVVKSLEVSSRPGILLFKRFIIAWISINHGIVFQTSITDNLMNEKITENASEIIELSQNHLNCFLPRTFVVLVRRANCCRDDNVTTSLK